MKKYFSGFVLSYLRFFAKLKLRRINPKIIGVTGSVGKTSLITALHTIISPSLRTKTTFRGNSESGIPLEILGIKMKNFSTLSWLTTMALAPLKLIDNEKYEVLIVEMGVDAPSEPKNMGYLLKIVKPQIGIMLNVAPVHTEQFNGDIDAIAREKGLLVTTMDANGVAIVNGDDERIAKLIPEIKAKVLTFGNSFRFSLLTTNYQLQTFSTKFGFKYHNQGYELNFKNKVFFREYAHIFAAAILAAKELGISITNSIEKLERNYVLPLGRLSILRGENNSTIIDSSYNASPIAVMSCLELLKNIKTEGHKIAVLGDMRELGNLDAEEHRKVGQKIGEIADYVVFVGPLIKKYALPALLATGFDKGKTFSFEKSKGVGEFIRKNILYSEDLVLVKGSQNTIFLEQTVYELMREKTLAKKLLCRQSEYWQKTREKFFRS